MEAGKFFLLRRFTWVLCVVLFAGCSGNDNSKEGRTDALMESEVELSDDFTFFSESVNEETVMGNQGNLINEGYVFESDDFVFFSLENKIYKEKKDGDGTGKQLLVEEEAGCRELCVSGGYVYYISNARIKRIGINGGEVTVLTEEPAVYMQMTKGKIYFAGAGIFSMNIDGSDLKLLTKEGITDENNPDLCWVNLYKDYVLYVSPSENYTLYAVKKDGTHVFKVTETVYYPVVEGDSVFYQGEEYIIRKLSLVTREESDVTEEYEARQIFYETSMYTMDFRGIYCRTDGEGKEQIFPMGVTDFEEKGNDYFVDLFWVTSNRIYFMGTTPELQNYSELKYIDRITGEIGVIK